MIGAHGELAGVPTGFHSLDEIINGLFPGQMIVVAARPGMGKSTLALDFVRSCSLRHKKASVIFSLEMSKSEIAMRMFSAEASIPLNRIRSGDLNDDEWSKLVRKSAEIADKPLFIDDSPNLSMMEIRAKARRLKAEHGLHMIIIDYIQLMQGRGRFESRQAEIASISRSLKGLAKELQVPIVALSQLSRASETRADHRPQLSDLRESGSIEQDADIVMFVFREEYYKEREKPSDSDLDAMAKWQQVMEQCHGKAEVILGKQRHGPIGTVELSFEGQFTRFGNLAKDRQAQWD